MKVALLAAIACAMAAGAASATEPPAPLPDKFAAICDAFGPGYHLIPGTQTCVKIQGYVKMTVTVGSKGSLPHDFLGPPKPGH